MTTRARRTTTLAGPNRFVLGAATGGLVVLASAATALLVLTGTSAVDPGITASPPLPTAAPPVSAPGVVVLPSAPRAPSTAGTRTSRAGAASRPLASPLRRTPPAALSVFAPPAAAVAAQPAPAALAFTDAGPGSAPIAADPGLATLLRAGGAATAPMTKAQLRDERRALRAAAKGAVRANDLAALLSALTGLAAPPDARTATALRNAAASGGADRAAAVQAAVARIAHLAARAQRAVEHGSGHDRAGRTAQRRAAEQAAKALRKHGAKAVRGHAVKGSRKHAEGRDNKHAAKHGNRFADEHPGRSADNAQDDGE